MPFEMPLQELPVDARLVVVALEVAERRELDEVRIPLVRLREECEVGVPLRLGAAVVRDVDLTAHDRLDAGLARLAKELNGAGERAVVRERHGGHLEPRGLLHEAGNPARPVEDRVLRVHVQVDEVRAARPTGGPSYRSMGLPIWLQIGIASATSDRAKTPEGGRFASAAPLPPRRLGGASTRPRRTRAGRRAGARCPADPRGR